MDSLERRELKRVGVTAWCATQGWTAEPCRPDVDERFWTWEIEGADMRTRLRLSISREVLDALEEAALVALLDRLDIRERIERNPGKQAFVVTKRALGETPRWQALVERQTDTFALLIAHGDDV